MANENEKQAAAEASLRFVKEGQIVGLGTGSTAAFAVELIGERVKAGLKIKGIPTSEPHPGTGRESGHTVDHAGRKPAARHHH